jgi:hypothetical protein
VNKSSMVNTNVHYKYSVIHPVEEEGIPRVIQ